MKIKKYVWIIGGDGIQSNKVFSYPAQVRLFAKEKGFSVYDETCTRFDMIVFCKKENGRENGFFALRRELV